MKTVNPNHPSRLKILAYLRKDPSASLNEICAAVGLCRTAVRHHLMNLDREGVIERIVERGNRGRYPKHIKRHQKVSSEKLTESTGYAALYAKQGRGANAFVPRKAKKHDKLQERIDRVVEKALKRESNIQHDVIRHQNARLRISGAHKVG